MIRSTNLASGEDNANKFGNQRDQVHKDSFDILTRENIK